MLLNLLRSSPALRRLHEMLRPHKFVARREDDRFGLFNRQTRELLGGFAIGSDDTVVDVGCGAGCASAFAAECGAAVYAVDVDPHALAAAEERMRGRKSARSFRTLLSDANPLPLPDGLATRVVAQEVLEHVDAPRQFLAELVRIGQPDALYLLSVPDPVAEKVQKKLAPDAYWRKPNHLRILEREQFVGLVRDAGLRIEKRLSSSFFWSMWWILFWSGEGDLECGTPGTPVLAHWNKTWAALLNTPNGPRIKQALDELMPKSQVILARKAA
ncbi:MAG TPA: class I SAM-dependent methyltransferase [Gemmataceae bacterium]|nr:class I SAM-dependent methyltransferase [Gemmataceae bacterium]